MPSPFYWYYLYASHSFQPPPYPPRPTLPTRALQLLDSETKVKLPEYESNGQHYVEAGGFRMRAASPLPLNRTYRAQRRAPCHVPPNRRRARSRHSLPPEPGAEYFVRIESHAAGTRSIATVRVDGAFIGYIWQHGPHNHLVAELGPPDNSGDAKEFEFKTTSFRFAQSFKKAEGGGAGSGQVGQVEVAWTEGIDTAAKSDPIHGSWNASDGGGHVDGKKKVNTPPTTSRHATHATPHYDTHPHRT